MKSPDSIPSLSLHLRTDTLAGFVIDNDATTNFDDSEGTPQTHVTSDAAGAALR